MKAFKFSLQALLTLREQQEQTALQAYGKALNAQERAASRLESARLELEEARHYFQNQLLEGCSSDELTQLHDWILNREQRCHDYEVAAEKAREEARQAFAKLLTARHATAVLMKLQEKQKREHQRRQRRREQHAIDEQAGRQNALALLLNQSRESLWN